LEVGTRKSNRIINLLLHSNQKLPGELGLRKSNRIKIPIHPESDFFTVRLRKRKKPLHQQPHSCVFCLSWMWLGPTRWVGGMYRPLALVFD
jgi:hypothetical protein